MPWFKVDDSFYRHPKTAPLSFAAKGVWIHAGTWCADQLTDGFVPERILRSWHVPPELVAELVDAECWIKVDGGYQFHDWLDYQPSRESVLASNFKAKQRMRAKRSAEVRANNGRTIAEQLPNFADVRDALQACSEAPVPVPDPIKNSLTRAREEQNPVQDGSDFMQSVTTKRHFHPAEWRSQLERIGLKPASERATVIASIQADAFIQANRHILDPTFVLKQWDRHVAGNPPIKSIARASSGGRYAGPSRVATAAEYEADKTEKAPWET